MSKFKLTVEATRAHLSFSLDDVEYPDGDTSPPDIVILPPIPGFVADGEDMDRAFVKLGCYLDGTGGHFRYMRARVLDLTDELGQEEAHGHGAETPPAA